MARGNPYARGGDVMKTRSEKRKEKHAKLAKTNRVIRLKRRLGRIAAKKFAGQEDHHMTALMESYILRRKAERAAEKAKEEQNEDATHGKKKPTLGSSGEVPPKDDSEIDEDEESDALSLGNGDDKDIAFEMDDGEEEEEKRSATSRRRGMDNRGSHLVSRDASRGGRSRSWQSSKRELAATPKQSGRVYGSSDSQRGHRGSVGRGGQRFSNQRGPNASHYLQRSRKVPTRSLY